MKLTKKIFLFAIAPLLLALFAIAITVYHQASVLAEEQLGSIQAAHIASKEAELKNYVMLARQAIGHLYDSGRMDAAALESAREILTKLSFGDDGYFFVNDFEGRILVQPPQPQRIGRIELDLKDANSTPVIQNLIKRAQSGGGFEQYTTVKPSTGGITPKLAYVMALPNWGWVLGTGVYLDDVQNSLAEVESKVSGSILRTMLWIIAIAFVSVAAIFLGLIRNIRERTLADERLGIANDELTRLTQRVIAARDEERKRIAEDLHDGVKPMLVAIKLQIETGMAELRQIGQTTTEDSAFKSAAELLRETLREIRRIIHGVRPIERESVGLDQALNQFALNMSQSALSVKFSRVGQTGGLSAPAEEALLLTAQEALANVVQHASASEALVRLKGNPQFIKLTICDNGRGFDKDCISHNSYRGIGLRSMQARLESLGGKFRLRSTSRGTVVLAAISRC